MCCTRSCRSATATRRRSPSSSSSPRASPSPTGSGRRSSSSRRHERRATLGASDGYRETTSAEDNRRFPALGRQPMIETDRLISPAQASAHEEAFERSLRPRQLSEYVGQEKIRGQLAIFIEAARTRREALDHILFFGPPGLGKTTLAHIVAREMGVDFHATAGPVIQRPADLVAMLSKLAPREVLFIDEIHRLPPTAAEYLYPAMEDYQIDLIIGQGPGARSIRYRLAPFTLIGATTRSGLITRPLRERFGIPLRLVFYEPAELGTIIGRAARLLGIELCPDGAAEIAQRSRGTPRVAIRLLRRVRDFAAVNGLSSVDALAADGALQRLDVDARGLDGMDRRYLRGMADNS